jgi:hypothetical protein
VKKVVLMGRYAFADRWFESSEDDVHADDVVRRMNCFQFRERLYSTVSGGEQRRYCCGSAITAGAIALTGFIGFIGLIVPHLVRSRTSAGNRVLMPCSLFLGGVLLASCDTLGRVVRPPAELPAGAVMAIVGGGPYLVWLVRRKF